jgi:hypothetical protein
MSDRLRATITENEHSVTAKISYCDLKIFLAHQLVTNHPKELENTDYPLLSIDISEGKFEGVSVHFEKGKNEDS